MIHFKNVRKVSKRNQGSQINNWNMNVKIRQKRPNMGFGGSQNLGTVLKLYVVINCEGFTKLNTKKYLYTLPQHNLTAPPTETVTTIQNIGED